jgi:hypothetical protein
MAGVAVTFAVGTGGGSVTGASATTGANGIAAVGGWTLGTTAGTNTVTASSGSLPAVSFTATGTAGPAANVTKTAGDNQSAVAGTAVATAPSVTVKDANSNVVSGATVTFAVASGGGSVTGATQTTSSSGVATVGGWTLGSNGGTNTLTATAGSVSATFTATGTVTITLEKTSGDNQTTLAGDPVTAPSVTVKQNGSALSGAGVTFAAGSNSGTVTGGSQTTNSAGLATVGKWRLGPAGTSTLTASTSGASAVAFTATALDPCQNGYTATAGVAKTWDIHNLDCLLNDGRRGDSWLMTLAAGTYSFTETSSEIGTSLALYTNVAQSKFIASSPSSTSNTASTAFKAIVKAGDYYTLAMNGAPGQVGGYTFTFNTANASITNCEYVFVMRGVTTTQSITNTDCVETGGFFDDSFWIWLEPNASVTVTMSSTAVDSYVYAVDVNGTTVAFNNDKNSTTKDAEITWTAPAAGGFYRILTSTNNLNETGSYTLTIN